MQTFSPPPPVKTLTDSYSDRRCAGRTLGTRSPSGMVRKGADVEKLIAIDNGALRFQPLLKPGWGRQGIAYGPYARTNGLTFAAFLLNGHNTSQVDKIEPLRRRLHRWWLGSETEKPRKRLLRWITSQPKQGRWRQLLGWICSTPRFSRAFPFLSSINENLAVGWFPQEVPADPKAEGNSFIVHATGAENGELWMRVGANLLSAVKGVQNVPVYYIVVLREQGAAYYVASLPKARGFVSYPYMRPLAIDPFSEEATVYAALYQSVLGQIGFRVDTRVYGTQVAQIAEIATWYGTACAADRLIGKGSLEGTKAEVGGCWKVYRGNYILTNRGAQALATNSLAVLECPTPTGLIHLLVETAERAAAVRLLWRVAAQNSYWSFWADGEGCQLQIEANGRREILAASALWHLQPNSLNSLQILDDGETFSLTLNGQLVFNKRFTDCRLQDATGVGIGAIAANSHQYVRHFEAHPRCVPIPSELDLGAPWMAAGTQIAIADDFTGSARDLLGKPTIKGGKVWHKEMGVGAIALTGKGAAKVCANAKQPNPGRTAYTLAWDTPDFADLQIEIVPPGTQRGQREKGRGGLIFWQDANNYIIINNWLDDAYGGASLSSFFYLNGFEELYDAVWTNVGSRVYWGVPHTLRTVFDGMHYTSYINDEPVLYRALTDVYADASRLAINRVGIVANWEWGNDTGSTFRNWIAKSL